VGRRNRDASARHTGVRREIAAAYRPGLDEDPAARAEVGRRIAALGNAENESYGIELGYAYAGSPVVCTDPGARIPDDPVRYEPTTAPGVRMPSVLLRDGTPVFDRLGPWFTLACFGTAQPGEALPAAAARRGLPLALLRPEEPGLARIYGDVLLLVRPDGHIAWRGSGCEDARGADAILRRALGWDEGW
jgi:hypothetical protein